MLCQTDVCAAALMLLGRDAARMVHVASCVSLKILMVTDKRQRTQPLLMIAMFQGSEADASVTPEAAARRAKRGASLQDMRDPNPPETGVISMPGSCVCAVGVLCLPAFPVGRSVVQCSHSTKPRPIMRAALKGRIQHAQAVELKAGSTAFSMCKCIRRRMAWPPCGAYANLTQILRICIP